VEIRVVPGLWSKRYGLSQNLKALSVQQLLLRKSTIIAYYDEQVERRKKRSESIERGERE
jgi:hypothetical protein